MSGSEDDGDRVRWDLDPLRRAVVGVADDIATGINAGSHGMRLANGKILIEVDDTIRCTGPNEGVPDGTKLAHRADPAVAHLLCGGNGGDTGIGISGRVHVDSGVRRA